MIDGSGSIRDANPADGSFDNWQLLLEFLANVARRLSISQAGTHVGAVVFSDRGTLLFGLDEFSNGNDLANAFLGITYPGANTNTSGGLWVARSQLFNARRGDRPNVPNLLIVITDGKSTFDADRTIPTAEDLRRDGVEMVSIGVTNSIDEDELRGLSSSPQVRGQNYFTSVDFQQLETIIEGLLVQACARTPPPPPPTTPPGKSFSSPLILGASFNFLMKILTPA